MPRVMLYVREADAAIWDRARALADARQESLSALVATALEHVLGPDAGAAALAAGAGDGMATIELEGWDWFRRDEPRRLRFTGARVAQAGTVTAYLTRGRRIVLEEWQILDERYLAVFESFDALHGHPIAQALDTGLLVDLAAAAGSRYVEVVE